VTKNRFQQLWMYKIFKHRKHPCIWANCILICNNKIFFLCFFSVYSFCNATFFHSGYVIKPAQPSSAIYWSPPFTGHPDLLLKSKLTEKWAIKKGYEAKSNAINSTFWGKWRTWVFFELPTFRDMKHFCFLLVVTLWKVSMLVILHHLLIIN